MIRIFTAIVVAALSSLLLVGCSSQSAPGAGMTATANEQHCVVYLLRHGEKDTLPEGDPALSAAGQQRAEQLARVLQDVPVSRIYSTDYRRTRQTVAPLAAQKNLPVLIYNPRDLPGAAAALCREVGVAVVAGHSNTTPTLVALLGGEAGPPIVEKSEFDRLYLLVKTSGKTTTLLQRYGN